MSTHQIAADQAATGDTAMKHSKYTVEIGGESARFSDLRQSLVYAKHMSTRTPQITIEVIGKDGIACQYEGGEPTPEFKGHHTAAFIG